MKIKIRKRIRINSKIRTTKNTKSTKKRLSWSKLGKRNLRLHAEAIEAGERIKARGTRSARWIAADALRELRSAKVTARLKRKG